MTVFPSSPSPDPDRDRGLYEKYHVERLDGRDGMGQKHEFCQYFVLDLTHDPYAGHALKAYADAIRHDYPVLARELTEMLGKGGPPYRLPHEGNG